MQETFERIAEHLYKRRYQTAGGAWREVYYARFTDWRGIRRKFPLGDDVDHARDKLGVLHRRNEAEFDFDKEKQERKIRVAENAPKVSLMAPLAKLFGPCVYIVKEPGSESILYIGMSVKGIARLGDHGHSVIAKLKAEGVIVKIIFRDDAESARELESRLILRFKPKLNSILDLRPINRSASNGGNHETNL